MKYTDANYAWERLAETFVWHDGRLQQVVERDRRNSFYLRDKDHRNSQVNLEDIDLSPPTLGYVNHNESCCYITRAPMRRDWKQGIRPGNLRQYSRDENQETIVFRNRSDIYLLEHAPKNDYPSFKECLDKIEETHRSRAFSRHFCINERGDLWYKGLYQVGSVSKESDSLLLLKQRFVHLTEQLTEETSNQQMEVRIV